MSPAASRSSRATDLFPVRFFVEWHPTVDIEAKCIDLGMTRDDGTSFWDWVEIDDHARTRIFRDFGAAVEFALKIAPRDCFGGARIYRQTERVIKDGKRSFIRWDNECFWDGINGSDKPDPMKPDEWVE